MSAYICGDQTIMAAAEGITTWLFGNPDNAPTLYALLRMANERAVGIRYDEEDKHQPVDSSKRREYSDLEIIGSCECLAYQLEAAGVGRFPHTCSQLHEAAETIKQEGKKEGKWRLPNKTERIHFNGVYLPSTYTTPSRTVTVYDQPAEIPWGID